ncbi:MAG: menaquinone biosynthesis protein [Blastocatellia bacterium]|nr:menaquinone biosynthesis protein [Blastocatellia bacterium]MBK6428080.1 menaquinone biosynthesis protein [Blastocatellia bacterium]
MTAVPRIAASSYLNSAPLVWAFSDGSQRDRCILEPDPAPSACARLLADKKVEGALIPSIEVQRIPGLSIARGVCVAARDRVRSVLLVSTVPLERIHTVALDTQSRTSVALVQILLGRFRGVRPRYSAAEPNLAEMLESADAALLIGDPAMTVDTAGADVYDLAELWWDATSLPFVFAVWGLRKNQFSESGPDFLSALTEGRAAIDQIADRYALSLGLDRASVVEYLTSNIHYELDGEGLAGLERFYRLAAEEGLITEPSPLSFWPDKG